jgi:hypothetical protein|tara:strand:- start:587 stop:733 length:147 start_codon:yes stop_codon:yes gene_type:complete
VLEDVGAVTSILHAPPGKYQIERVPVTERQNERTWALLEERVMYITFA